jgi:hypothetical protein
LETFKTAVRGTVFVFVLIAAAVTFAGLDPSSKAEVEAVATEAGNSDNKVSASTATTQKKSDHEVITAELGVSY